MKRWISVLALVALAACSAPPAPGCAGGAAPTDVVPEATYVLLKCPDGHPVTIPVASAGSGYTSGQSATNDPYFWMWLMGSSGGSYTHYHYFPRTAYYARPASYWTSSYRSRYTAAVSNRFYRSSYASSYRSGSRGYSYRSRGGRRR